jgi:hypothetical protein
MKITLLQKPGELEVRAFITCLQSALTTLKGPLTASARLEGFSQAGWPNLEVTGPDMEIFVELISRELGLAQTELSATNLNETYPAIVSTISKGYLEVDVGVEKPKALKVRVKPSTLQAQLADGKPLPAREILDHYCLFPQSKTTVRITKLDPHESIAEGWLGDPQMDLFSDWVRTGLDRIQVYACSRQEVESALTRAHLERDIIALESMTLTVHSALCKLGTDAVGLIPKLGSFLERRELKPFLPKRILARCRPW